MTNKSRTKGSIAVNFYWTDPLKGITLLPFDADWHPGSPAAAWQPIIPEIIKACKSLSKLHVQAEKTEHEFPAIHILLIEPLQLADPNFFNHFTQWELRSFIPPVQRKRHANGRYNPVLSISFKDISTKNAVDQDDEQIFYPDINLDPRVKFLDSSIWHRYVPEHPADGTSFADCLEETLRELISYWEDGLYYTIPAVSTLEFQLRLLEHSYIGRFGDGGHETVVTPFKFHSERFMKNRSRSEEGAESFLKQKWNDASLLNTLNWRCLVVDDHAKELISTIDIKKYPPRLTKSMLLRRPMDRLYGKANPQQFELDLPDRNTDLVKASLEKLKKQSFDLIFLDHLLGERSDNTKKREYGHEFLEALLDDNNQDVPQLRRDFLGKYWIFPVSSFPFALNDKLTQIGISHLHSIWHLSNGGDPITTPHLYAFYLFRFMKQKIRDFFLDDKGLGLYLNEIPIRPKKNDAGSIRRWASYLHESLSRHENLLNLLLLQKMETKARLSPFSNSIVDFLEKHNRLQRTISWLRRIAQKLEARGSVSSAEFEAWRSELESSEFDAYRQSIDSFLEKVAKFKEEPNLAGLAQLKAIIFFAKEDRKEKEIFLRHLSSLKQELNVAFWDKDQISPGRHEHSAIEEQKNESHIFIFLFSANLIYDETLTAHWEDARKKAGSTIIPIYVESCHLGKYRAYKMLPDPDKSIAEFENINSAWRMVVVSIKNQIESEFPGAKK